MEHKVRDYGTVKGKGMSEVVRGGDPVVKEPVRGVMLSAMEYVRVTSEAYARGMADAEARLAMMLNGERVALVDCGKVWFELAEAIRRGSGK